MTHTSVKTVISALRHVGDVNRTTLRLTRVFIDGLKVITTATRISIMSGMYGMYAIVLRFGMSGMTWTWSSLMSQQSLTCILAGMLTDMPSSAEL